MGKVSLSIADVINWVNCKRQCPDSEVWLAEVSPYTRIQNDISTPSGFSVISHS